MTMDTNIYEVGYHLIPTLAEEAVPAEAEKVKAIIAAEAGEVISEANPELKNLAYPVSKTVRAIKSNYAKAYFGWVKFSATPEAILKIKVVLDASDTVLRHLIVGTVKESTLMADKEKRPTTRPEPAKEKANEEAIDKAINELHVS